MSEIPVPRRDAAAGPEFAGRTVVITGASSGIGLATARMLAERGAEVIGTARTEEGCARLARIGVEPVRCDITAAAGRSRLTARSSGVQHLVNCAGANQPMNIGLVDEASWDWTLDVNARAPFFLCQQIGRRLPPGGSIVNVASTAAKAAVPEVAVYAAAKAAVLSFTRSFALAYADRGIRVNAVLPKIIRTPMQTNYLRGVAEATGVPREELDRQRLAGIPLGRAGEPEECAEVICFLLSSRSSYMTGQSVNVTGGWLMS